MGSKTLRLRCVRCGNWHDTHVDDPWGPEICTPCFQKYLKHEGAAAVRFVQRYHKGSERHPTIIALQRAIWGAR